MNVLTRRVFRLPVYVWLLWAAAAIVLAACPMLLSDPGMWPYLLDPELLALLVIIGVQYSRIQFVLVQARLRDLVRRAVGQRPR